MQKYFKRLPEWVKAWQYNGELREEMPEWVQKLEDERLLNVFTRNKYCDYIVFEGKKVRETDWFVIFYDNQKLMSNEAFIDMFEIEGKE